MHPQLLHQIADDRVIGRRRSRPPPVGRRPRRTGPGVTARLRAAAGGILITLGTRVAGPRYGTAGLRRTPT